MTLSIQKSSLPGGIFLNFTSDMEGLRTHQCPKVLVDGKEMYLTYRDNNQGEMSFITLDEDHIYICKEVSIQGIETDHLDVIFLEVVENREWTKGW